MTTHSRAGLDMRGWPESRVGQRAITLAGLGVAGIVLLVLGFALDIVEPADSYTDSWAQLVWGVGIWVCAVAAFVAGLVAIVRHHERSWMVVLATALGLLPVVLLLSEIALGKF
jgi:membrane-bound ClpP family serine protease